MAVTSAREIERVRQVYADYEASGPKHVWAPEHPAHRAMSRQRARVLGELLARTGRLPLDRQRILDVGCGDGGVLWKMRRFGARPEHSLGIDVRPDALASGRQKHRGLGLTCGDGTRLPYRSESVDLVLAFTLFTSILDDRVARDVAAEIGRVLRPGGALVWYDFRVSNPRNPHVRGMSRAQILGLFPGWTAQLRRVTLFPPIARRLGRTTPVLYPILATIPPLRTHWLGLLERP